jgi:putative transposase
MTELSNTSESEQGINVDMTLTPSYDGVRQLQPSATAESQAQSKKTTCQDKPRTCKRNSQKPKSSKTADQGSISKEKDLTPYWTEQSQEKSSLLWLPTEIVFAGSDSILFASSSSGAAAKSWFSTTRKAAPTHLKKSLSMTCSQLSTFSLAESTAGVVTKTRTRKNRLRLTPQQRLLFKSWTGCARFVYNRTIEHLSTPGTFANWKTLKPLIISALPDWCAKVPYQIKSFAVKDACEAVTNAKRKFLKTGKFQEVNFRTKLSPRQSFGVPGAAILPHGIYPTLTGPGLRYTESLPPKRVGKKSKSGLATLSDGKLLYENGKWYLCVPEQITISLRAENQGESKRVVAVDPGIRTFATFYSPDECGEIAKGDYTRLFRLAMHLDNLYSRLDKRRKEGRVGARKRQGLRKATTRLRARFANLIDELHWKSITFLLSNFDVVLLPTFETSQMSKKSQRKIGRKSVRSMLSYAFYRFSQRLEWKAACLGKVVIRVNEAYTTKTASWTGEIIKNLGGRKTIKSAGLSVSRDINGARGIFLRALGDHPSLLSMEEVVQC